MASVRDWITGRNRGGDSDGGDSGGSPGGRTAGRVAGAVAGGPVGGIIGGILGEKVGEAIQNRGPQPDTTAGQDYARGLPGSVETGLIGPGHPLEGSIIPGYTVPGGIDIRGGQGPLGGGLPSNSFTINNPGNIPGGFDLGSFLGSGSGSGIVNLPNVPGVGGGGGGSVPGTPPIVDIPTTPSGPSDNPVQFFFDQPENGYYLSDDGRESILSNRGPGSSPVDNTFRKLGLGGEATIGGYPPSADGPFKSVAPPGNPWNLPNPGGHVPTPGVGLNPWPGLLDFTGGS